MNVYKKYSSNLELLYRRRLAICSHALEKGSGIRNPRQSFGQGKANEILNFLDIYLSNGYNPGCWEFYEANSVLNYYFELMNSNGVEIKELIDKYQEIKKRFDNIDFNHSICKAGVKTLNSEELLPDQQEREALQLAIKKRRSIRFFSKDPIDEKTIHEVLQLAQFAPSACNRQPTRIYYTLDQEKNAAVDRCVPGNNSFKGEIPYYFVVTSERLAFENYELYQWYINGGIYMGVLSLALHSFGLGGIIFQWPNLCVHEKEIRSIVPIPENETIVALVGFGKIDENVKVIEADRRSIDYYHEF